MNMPMTESDRLLHTVLHGIPVKRSVIQKRCTPHAQEVINELLAQGRLVVDGRTLRASQSFMEEQQQEEARLLGEAVERAEGAE